MSTQAPSEVLNPLANQFGYTKLFHPRGALVSLPVPADPLAAFEHVSKCLDVGFLVIAPGLEEGEHKEQVGYVLKGLFERDGESTPVLLLYDANEAHSFSFLKVYLNTYAEIQAFESASGVKLDALPEYVGNDKPERGKSAKLDQFIVKMQKSFSVILKNNPKFDEAARADAQKRNEIYKVPRRLFVRWDDPHAKPAEKTDDKPQDQSQPPQQQQQFPHANGWTLEQALRECHNAGITKEELRAAIKHAHPDSEGWRMLRDTAVAQRLIQQKKQPLAPPPLKEGDIPFAWLIGMVGTAIATAGMFV